MLSMSNTGEGLGDDLVDPLLEQFVAHIFAKRIVAALEELSAVSHTLINRNGVAVLVLQHAATDLAEVVDHVEILVLVRRARSSLEQTCWSNSTTPILASAPAHNSEYW